ncbi:MAG TPA: NAD(P)-binding domain-containing protein, partial [Gemmatimonadaceae bacterium]|nr:NAD(P)-binding domain-containing protein [Gemmatimonadaceae bacterium]
MRVGVLGTGVVGKTLATKLVKLGHDVRMGSRTAGGDKGETVGGRSRWRIVGGYVRGRGYP